MNTEASVKTETGNKNEGRSKKVGLIGDSITELSEYPNYLAQMLGSKFEVKNFGVSGSSVMLDAYTPYIYTEAFQIAIKFQPTFAVIMLGTNDSSQERSLNSGRFEKDYIFMVKKFQSLLLKTRIFLVTPPQILSDVLGYNNKILEQKIIPIIEKVAIRTCLPLIDVHSALNSSSFFFDGVHPNASGAKVIAQFVHNSLTTINT